MELYWSLLRTLNFKTVHFFCQLGFLSVQKSLEVNDQQNGIWPARLFALVEFGAHVRLRYPSALHSPSKIHPRIYENPSSWWKTLVLILQMQDLFSFIHILLLKLTLTIQWRERCWGGRFGGRGDDKNMGLKIRPDLIPAQPVTDYTSNTYSSFLHHSFIMCKWDAVVPTPLNWFKD